MNLKKGTMNLIEELEKFIKEAKDARELKRAQAVKMILQQKSYHEIKECVGVSHSFISKWKNQVLLNGVESLRVQYKGGKGYLKTEQVEEIIEWLQCQKNWSTDQLRAHIDEHYGVVFQSNQSYYSLFEKAKISWKKTQKKNPKKDDKLVEIKKQEIENFLEERREEIESEKLAVFMVDECHLLHGDAIGYVWGPTSERVEVPIKNEKDRQTYYGAIDYYNHEFLLKSYSRGNSKNTQDFVDYLQCQRPGQKIAIFWDGASYHGSQEMRNYLAEINGELSSSEWQVTCVKFAPNAPEQNPVEDIWLQTKNFVRKFSHYCKSFKAVKCLFELFATGQVFDFPKLYEYADFSQPI